MFDKLAIAATIGVGIAIGVAWPMPNKTTQTGAGAKTTDVLIERSADHHYYADGTVNGHPVHFLIDTGAAETALTEADAKAVGIAVDPTKFDVIGDGASGMVRGEYVQLKSLELQGIRQKSPQAVVVAGSSVSLLGQPFLEAVDEIVIRRGEMTLSSHSGA